MSLVLGFVGAFRFGLGQRLVGEFGDDDAIRQAERGLKTIGQPRSYVLAYDEAIHHHVDVVFVLFVEFGRVGDLGEGTVDFDALESLLLKFGELLFELALAPARDRGQQIEPCALRQLHHAVDHLAHRLAFDGQPCRRRVGHANACKQQPQVVVDFGDGADGRARVLGRRLLLDRDGR